MAGSMPEVNGQYATRSTIFESTTAGWLLFVPANPRRYYLKFGRLSPIGLQSSILPGPVPNGFTPTTNEADLGPFLWRDMPAAVTGEWYIFYNVGEQWHILEQIFNGD